jgi:flagellar hook-basal body complex protein FliE
MAESIIGPLGQPERSGIGSVVRRASPAPGDKSFQDFLKESIVQANRMQVDAEKAINDLSVGKTENMGEVLAAVRKAELSFNLMMEIRNKLVDAYNEVMRMRV